MHKDMNGTFENGGVTINCHLHLTMDVDDINIASATVSLYFYGVEYCESKKNYGKQVSTKDKDKVCWRAKVIWKERLG